MKKRPAFDEAPDGISNKLPSPRNTPTPGSQSKGKRKVKKTPVVKKTQESVPVEDSGVPSDDGMKNEVYVRTMPTVTHKLDFRNGGEANINLLDAKDSQQPSLSFVEKPVRGHTETKSTFSNLNTAIAKKNEYFFEDSFHSGGAPPFIGDFTEISRHGVEDSVEQKTMFSFAKKS